jgi:hypothetical protein
MNTDHLLVPMDLSSILIAVAIASCVLAANSFLFPRLRSAQKGDGINSHHQGRLIVLAVIGALAAALLAPVIFLGRQIHVTDQLRLQLSEANVHLNQQATSRARAEEELADSESRLHAARAECDTLQSALVAKRRDLADARATIDELRSPPELVKLQDALRRITEKDKELDSVQRKLDGVSQENELYRKFLRDHLDADSPKSAEQRLIGLKAAARGNTKPITVRGHVNSALGDTFGHKSSLFFLQAVSAELSDSAFEAELTTGTWKAYVRSESKITYLGKVDVPTAKEPELPDQNLVKNKVPPEVRTLGPASSQRDFHAAASPAPSRPAAGKQKD